MLNVWLTGSKLTGNRRCAPVIPILENRILIGALSALCLLCFATPGQGQTPNAGLQAQVEALAAEQGFAASGLEALGESPLAARPRGTAEQQLKQLLQDREYTVIFDAAGKVTELRIPKQRAPAAAARHRTPLPRPGGWRRVEVELTGPNGKPKALGFIADGDTTITLVSTAYITSLGYKVGDFEKGTIRTSRGRIPARLGRLDILRAGSAAIHNVPFAFIEDRQFYDDSGPEALVLDAVTAGRLGFDVPEPSESGVGATNWFLSVFGFGLAQALALPILLRRFGLIKIHQIGRACGIGFVYGAFCGPVFVLLFAAFHDTAAEFGSLGLKVLWALALIPFLLPIAAPNLAPHLQRRNLWPF